MSSDIPLAVPLDDPGVRATGRAIATDRNELVRRGVTDPRDIAETQSKAAKALAATEGRGNGFTVRAGEKTWLARVP
jgi:hypothetical protein